MFQLVYTSSATHLMERSELEAILTEARKNNGRLGVTGMLLYRSGSFLQLLEGEKDTVRALYEGIAQDERHHDATIIITRHAEHRDFLDWTMSFHLAEDEDREGLLEDLPDGFTPFMEEEFDVNRLTDDPSQAQQALLEFRDIAQRASPSRL